MDAVQIVDYLMNAYIDAPVEEWGIILEETDMPNIGGCMCATFSTILTLLFPEQFVNWIAPVLMDLFAFQ